MKDMKWNKNTETNQVKISEIENSLSQFKISMKSIIDKINQVEQKISGLTTR